MQRDRFVSCTPENNRPLEAKLKVLGRTKRKHVRMDVRVIRRRMTLKASIKEVVANWTGNLRNVRDVQRFHPVDAEGVDILRIVRPRHRSALRRPKPRVGFSSGNFMSQEMK